MESTFETARPWPQPTAQRNSLHTDNSESHDRVCDILSSHAAERGIDRSDALLLLQHAPTQALLAAASPEVISENAS